MGYISNPSYFTAERGINVVTGVDAGVGATGARLFLAGTGAGNYTAGLNNMVVIGAFSLAAGTFAAPITDANLTGSVIIGVESAEALTSSTSVGIGAPMTILGSNVLSTAVDFGGAVLIGQGILQNYVNVAAGRNTLGNVIIGNGSCAGATGSLGSFNSLTAIGQGVFAGAGTQDTTGCVFIGYQAVGGLGPAGSGTSANHVAIGYQAGFTMTHGQANVLIGYAAASTIVTGQQNVVIGASTNCPSTSTDNVVIGYAAGGSGGAFNGCILLGYEAGSASVVSAANQILIGQGAGSLLSDVANQFSIDTYDGVTHRTLFWGDMGAGNLLVGNTAASVAAHEFGGAGATNVLKLLNGTKGGSNPVGGGYFYCTAGALHYVGTSGTDTALAVA